ncbi:MAG: S-layer homology domain-containing protein [Candidatus Margulisbacteria bacterium]|nr:S-layer homology domain-containing protein [Candidatus Margulisiibacteriota bacterium]MBU1022060.1 S-layer homology domain-containing protein [Candidatus Margulisiibacteriota bacterium]MBU1729655.1 S-layer homology domain-containing protein [Candidatus Margulisiibacteriota bacterium]MBU1954975.1 S-layer homology domain-containing protein [Candidatus Margulisiibacteriota bacterium]
MRRKFALSVLIGLLLITLFSVAAVSSDEFRDLPQDSSHWAKDAVYDLAERGVISGYPDGTFRGKKDIDRYEMAAFISKLDTKLSPVAAKNEKIIAELRFETQRLKYDLAEMKREAPKRFGSVDTSYKIHRTLIGEGQKGPEAYYRFKYSVHKDFGDGAKAGINFDTNDAGFNTTITREVFLTMFDLSGQVTYGDVIYTANIGPGSLVFTPTDIDAYENDEVYLRPKSSVSAEKNIFGVNSKLSYVAHQIDASGLIGLNEIRTDFSWYTKNVPLVQRTDFDFTAHYLFANMSSNNLNDFHLIGEFTSDFLISRKVRKILILGLGAAADFPHGAYVSGEIRLRDYFNTGTDLAVMFKKVGSKFREGLDPLGTYRFVGLNYDGDLVLDGKVDCALAISQQLANNLKLDGMVDFQLTGAYQLGPDYVGTSTVAGLVLNYAYAENVQVLFGYKATLTPSGVDQFGRVTDTQQDEAGVKVSYSF